MADAIQVLEHILNVNITSPSDRNDSFPPVLSGVQELIQSAKGAGQDLDFRNVTSSICFEIVTQHVEGRLRDGKYTAKVGSGNNSSSPGPSTGLHDVQLKDLNSFLTYWFLDTLERAYFDERNYPKVIFHIVVYTQL